jgi:hypothetical protein
MEADVTSNGSGNPKDDCVEAGEGLDYGKGDRCLYPDERSGTLHTDCAYAAPS